MSRLPQVMVDGPLPAWIAEALMGHVETRTWADSPDSTYAQVQGLLTYGHPAVSEGLIEALPSLRVISNHGVGTDHIDSSAARNRGIPVGNTPDVLNGAVADLAFALMLATARRLPESIQLAAHPETKLFDQSAMHGQEVHGATLGIIGLGRIGMEIARRAVGFQMPVIYHNRKRNESAEAEVGASYSSLHELLAAADFVVLVVPLSESTQGLIGRAELAVMKSTSILINLARGLVVDTNALVEAMEAETIWGAGLDVTDPEPLPRNHPLLSMPNVIVTSHIGSATRQTRHRMAELAVQNLLLGLQGKPLIRSLP